MGGNWPENVVHSIGQLFWANWPEKVVHFKLVQVIFIWPTFLVPNQKKERATANNFALRASIAELLASTVGLLTSSVRLASTVELRASNAELLASTVELLASYVELYSKHLRSQTELPANKFVVTNVRVTCLQMTRRKRTFENRMRDVAAEFFSSFCTAPFTRA